MQAIEERAIATYQQTPIWLRYIDDTFTIVHQDEINTFHEHLNEQNPDIQFTFSTCLVILDNNWTKYGQQFTESRHIKYTDRLLDLSSYNPTVRTKLRLSRHWQDERD